MTPEYDTEMTEGDRGHKRQRSESRPAPKRESAEPANGIKGDDVNQLADKLAALGGLKPARTSIESKQLEVAIPRKGYENQVEYYPFDYAQRKYGRDVNLNSYTKVITDTEGPTRPLPQAYDSIPVDPGLSFHRRQEARKEQWAEWREELPGLPSKPSNGKENWNKLERDDPQAWYDTPDGPRRTRYAWNNPQKAGQDLPELRITVPSSNERGSRTVGVWRNDQLVVGDKTYDLSKMDSYDLADTFGADKVEIKSANHTFESIADLNERGEHEAERRFQHIKGNEIRYNPDTPELVVQHGDHLVSIDDIRDQKLWQGLPVLKQLNDRLEKRPESLRIGMSSREGDSFHNPKLMLENVDKDRFKELCATYNLSEERLSTNGKFFEGGPTWVQIEKGVYRNGDAVKKELPPGTQVLDVYDTTQLFTHETSNGKIKSSAKMLYATLRDDGPISAEVAKTFNMEARSGSRETYKQAAKQNTKQALQDLQGYESSSSVEGTPAKAAVKQEPNLARQSLVEGREGARQTSHGLAG